VAQLDDMTAEVVRLQQERDWKQFHAPKNVAIALVGEAAELASLYRFADQPEVADKLFDEVGDVVYNLLLFCNEAGINPAEAFARTIAKVEEKYPTEKYKGSPKKYNEQ
jgi:NTP pyrophosphatase (non-canonical NTP hydrolase)